MRTATTQYVTLESTKTRPALETKTQPKKKRAVLLTSVADVVDESDANGPWEDVGLTGDVDAAREGGRFSEAKMMSALAKKVNVNNWRKKQIRKYGKVREYGKRAPIKKKRKRVKT